MTEKCSSQTPQFVDPTIGFVTLPLRDIALGAVAERFYVGLRHRILYGYPITPEIVREHHARARAARDAAAIRQWRRRR